MGTSPVPSTSTLAVHGCVVVGWLVGSEGLPPSMQCKLSYKITQQLRLRTRQADGWETSRLIPRHGHILLHWVFLVLKVQIEDKRLPCLLCLHAGGNACLRLLLVGECENHLSGKPSSENLFLPFFPLHHQAKSSSDHHSRSCAYSSPRNALSVLLNPLFSSSFFLETRGMRAMCCVICTVT